MKENQNLQLLADPGNYRMKVEGHGSPLTLITGSPDEETLYAAASLCARYSDAGHLPEVKVTVSRNNENFFLKVRPADEETIRNLRIEKKKKPKIVIQTQ